MRNGAASLLGLLCSAAGADVKRSSARPTAATSTWLRRFARRAIADAVLALRADFGVHSMATPIEPSSSRERQDGGWRRRAAGHGARYEPLDIFRETPWYPR